MIYPLP